MAVEKWFYNSNTGAVEEHMNWSFFEVHLGIGWHGPFDTKQEALDYYTKYNALPASQGGGDGKWHAPAGLAQQFSEIPKTLGTEATNAGSSIVSQVLGGANVQSWFTRVAEILIGIVLVGVAIAKLTGTANIISKAAKVATL